MSKNKFQLKNLNFNQVLTIVLGAILLLQLIGIAYCNFALMENFVDADSSKVLMRVMKMWEHKSLVVPGWTHMTTMEWDCASMLALPLYGLTGNIFTAFGVANVLFALLYVGVMFVLFSDKEPIYPILASNFVLVPYSLGMLAYFNMMFFGAAQYVIKVLVPLLIIAMLLAYENGTNVKKRVLAGFVLAFSFITAASSGLYVVLVGVLPLFVAYFAYKLLKREKVGLEIVSITVVDFVLSFVGIILNNKLGSAKGNSMVLIAVQDIYQNITSCLIGIWELLGGVSYELETPIVSVAGIRILVRSTFALLFVVCGIVASIRIIKKKGDLRITLLVSLIVWNLFILFHSRTSYGCPTYEYRYHLITVIPLMLLTTLLLLEAFMKASKVQKFVFGLVGVMALLVLNAVSFHQVITAPDQNAEYKQLVEYCDDLDAEYVYLYGDSEGSEIARILSGNNKHYLMATDGGASVVYGYYAKYHAMPIVQENAIMVVKDPAMEKGAYFEILNNGFEYFDSVGDMHFYRVVAPKSK